MKKLKRFHVGNLTVLGQREMMDLSGGEKTFKCRTGETCNLFIEIMGITVQGKCYYSSNGTTVSCYCKNGNYSTTPGHGTSCWEKL
ncbi:hypothetical protein M1D30_13690 [Prevotella sp. E15-22]|uniref:hypothetical protein n=1 Tax=Prevotella sp. E15-22 TaxID=2937774 RepID=UPI002063FBD3|nr:hypothetical protein [Prevotella sp. E15-22]UPS44582.1 hypothetical protein M1D30_13690 [Prevotella sp. E15-22]